MALMGEKQLSFIQAAAGTNSIRFGVPRVGHFLASL
jgi:hypothetical protein